MNTIGNPKRPKTQRTATSGLNRVSTIFNDEFGWIFRKIDQGDDYGIDAFVDVVSDDGYVTGQSFALQIKYGRSYFEKQTANSVTYYGDTKHLNFYANCPSPVLLVVGQPGGPIYWRNFCLEETELTSKGWKTEIPKKNALSAAKYSELTSLLLDQINATSIAQRNREFAEFLDQFSLFLYAVPKMDIESGSAENFVNFCTRILKNVGTAKKVKEKLEVYTAEFDDDPRELWEIPQFTDWVKSLERHKFPWFYLSYLEPPYNWITLYFGSLCEGQSGEYYTDDAGNRRVALKLNFEKMIDLVEENFDRLNQISERVGLSESEVRALCYRSLTALQFPEEIVEAFKTNGS